MSERRDPIVESARCYLERGWMPVPVHTREKRPIPSDWPNYSAVTQELETAFRGNNVGLILGERSGGLVDVDLDCSEARELAALLLLPTGMKHGRDSTGAAHYWYLVTENAPALQQFKGVRGDMIVELRSTGGQTIVPPSVHPSGEVLAWSQTPLDPATVHVDDLTRHVQLLAACVVIARAWPAKGSRHDASLALSGTLLRAGVAAERATEIVTTVARLGKDEEWRLRASDAASTSKRMMEGKPVTGLAQLVCLLEPATGRQVAAWLPTLLQHGGPSYGQYGQDEQGIYELRGNAKHQREYLANFNAKIIKEVVESDGVNIQLLYDLEVTCADRHQTLTLTAADLSAMAWPLERVGSGAIVAPGRGSADRLRAAIQYLSGSVPREQRYSHLGWCELEGRRVYLHAAGAIDQDGHVDAVRAYVHEALSRYRIARPLSGELLPRAWESTYADLFRLGPDDVVLPTLAAVWRSVLGSPDFSLFVSGRTGVFKSALAALMLSHFGEFSDARHLPGTWQSTGNALEVLAFHAKDALLVVDDYVAVGTHNDVRRLQRDADRVLRGQGNNAGRLRLSRSAKLGQQHFPRGLLLSTGEDVPPGESLGARLLLMELKPGDIDSQMLTRCQGAAREGQYSRMLATYIQWLAGRDFGALLDSGLKRHRGALSSSGHPRTAGIVANLVAAADVFFEYCTSVGVLRDEEADGYLTRVREAVFASGQLHQEHAGDSDVATAFLRHASSAIVAKRAHVASSSGDAPNNPGALGWEKDNAGGWRSGGDRIGWSDGTNIYLDTDAALAVARRQADAMGTPLHCSPQTLRKRLKEGGHLQTLGEARNTLTVRRLVEDVRREVLHIRPGSLLDLAEPEQLRLPGAGRVGQAESTPGEEAEQ